MILFLDDDVSFIDNYGEELMNRGYPVSVAGSTDDALRVVDERGPELQLIVCDMMIPPGRTFENEETDMGLRTGDLFYERVRASLPDVPVVLFTNRNVAELEGNFRKDPRCQIFMKEELLPREFADMVADLLAQGRAS